MLVLHEVSKSFVMDRQVVPVLESISLAIHPGEIVGILGHSGAGKSTLLQITGLLEKPTTGKVLIDGSDVVCVNDFTKACIRNQKIGFVYQNHRLLGDFSALENVMLPMLIAGKNYNKAQEKSKALLEKIGLSHRIKHRPAKLSGGEQQRVALARALINQPILLLADEPTGNLDSQTSTLVFHLLLDMVRENKAMALIATHNPDLAQQMDRVVCLKDGKLQSSLSHL